MKSRLDVSWWWQQRWLWLFLIIGCAVRFFNLSESLYFTYDQGRDAYAIQRIVHGDLTLIGPTTGLEGFFTGPAWYYAGVPPEIYSGLVASPSVGSFFASAIRNKFRGEQQKVQG